jgi:hypothetical protein
VETQDTPLPLTAPKQDAEFVQAANAIFQRLLRIFFAFAIPFSAINFLYRLRQESASNSAPCLAAKR